MYPRKNSNFDDVLDIADYSYAENIDCLFFKRVHHKTDNIIVNKYIFHMWQKMMNDLAGIDHSEIVMWNKTIYFTYIKKEELRFCN